MRSRPKHSIHPGRPGQLPHPGHLQVGQTVEPFRSAGQDGQFDLPTQGFGEVVEQLPQVPGTVLRVPGFDDGCQLARRDHPVPHRPDHEVVGLFVREVRRFVGRDHLRLPGGPVPEFPQNPRDQGGQIPLGKPRVFPGQGPGTTE